MTETSPLLDRLAWRYATKKMDPARSVPADKVARIVEAARQAYIGVGAALIAAAFEQVDSTPMEGFDPAAVDEILGLKARGLRSVVIIPLGYRQEDGDWLVSLQKVRRPLDQFVTEV